MSSNKGIDLGIGLSFNPNVLRFREDGYVDPEVFEDFLKEVIEGPKLKDPYNMEVKIGLNMGTSRLYRGEEFTWPTLPIGIQLYGTRRLGNLNDVFQIANFVFEKASEGFLKEWKKKESNWVTISGLFSLGDLLKYNPPEGFFIRELGTQGGRQKVDETIMNNLKRDYVYKIISGWDLPGIVIPDSNLRFLDLDDPKHIIVGLEIAGLKLDKHSFYVGKYLDGVKQGELESSLERLFNNDPGLDIFNYPLNWDVWFRKKT